VMVMMPESSLFFYAYFTIVTTASLLVLPHFGY
jgi:hypothetical protein